MDEVLKKSMITDKENRLIRNGICFIGFILAMIQPVASFGQVMMHVTPNGLSSFLLTAENIVGVGALDVTIEYDPLVLMNPRVLMREGGAVTGIKAENPGTLLVSIDRENPDTQLSLFLQFVNPGRDWGRGAKSVTAVTAISRQVEQNISPASGANATPFTTSSEAGPEKKSAQPRASDAPSAGVNNTAPDPGISRLLEREESVLRRFMAFRGETSLRSFTALFERNDRGPAMQHPTIALSDGKTPVTITIELQQEEQGSPDIALWDATLVSLQKEGAKSWVATIVPSEGAWDVKLIFKVGSALIDFPLVVAPRVKLADGISEENALDALIGFCNDRSSERKWENVPHLNEFIFMANYLADAGKSSSRGKGQ